MNDSFGAAFGRLVKARRGKKWTQSSLAAAMFPNQEDAGENRKGDISKLERGKVANPNATTVTRIAEVLAITEAEIDVLRKHSQMSPQEQLDAVPSLSRNQLELLASRFELNRAFDYSDAELRSFLEKKSEEYRGFQALIDGLDDRIPQIHNLKGAAQAAAVDLDFDTVEDLLARVNEVELEIAAETSVARARNALIRGRPQQAYDLLSAAADSFGGVDPLEPARRRLDYAKLLSQNGQTYGGVGLALAERMLRQALTALDEKTTGWLWAMAQNNLAVTLGDQGRRHDGAKGAALLSEAAECYRAALRVRTETAHPVDWAMIQNNMATLEQARADHDTCTDPRPHLQAALDHVDRALTIFDPQHMPFDYGKTSTLRDHLRACLAQ